jgi:tellurite resistance protein TehA-like permease
MGSGIMWVAIFGMVVAYRLRTTFRVSVKVAASLPIAIAPAPSGPTVVRFASVGKPEASIPAAVREECRSCSPDRPFAVLRW